MRALRIVRIAAWSALPVVGGLYAGLAYFGTDMRAPPAATDAARIGGPFSLTDHAGERVDNATVSGRPYLAFFGFTNCPDVCPTTLYELTDLMQELGPAADRVRVLFVTADPERDTAGVLRDYLTAFDPRFAALRGTPEETTATLKAFGAVARKVTLDGGGYTVDHTAGVYMMDATGRFVGMLDMHEPRDVRLAKLRRLAGSAD